MGMTTKVRELLHGVCTTLMDMTPQYSRWTEVELVRYANLGQMAIAKYLPMAGARIDTVKLAPGPVQDLGKVLAANIKPGDGSPAVDTYGVALIGLMHNMGADGLTPGKPISVVDRYTLDTTDELWPTRTGTSVREYVVDKSTPRHFEVSPAPSNDVWVRLRWMVEPRRIPDGGAPGSPIYAYDGTSSALIGINDQFLEDLHNYVVAMALMKGSKNVQNIPKAQLHVGLFTASINAQATAIGSVNPNLKQLPFADSVPVSGG